MVHINEYLLLYYHLVTAESYNPEKDDEDVPTIYAKTDAQRSRLEEAIEPIFLFRSLDDVCIGLIFRYDC